MGSKAKKEHSDMASPVFESRLSRQALFGFRAAIILWSALTLYADWQLVDVIYRQLGAESYAVATGTMEISSTQTTHGEPGDTHPWFVYKFQARGEEFSGNRYRYGFLPSRPLFGNRSEAAAIARRFPLDRPVSVYFHRDNPKNCLLQPGLQSQDVVLALLLLPFNMIWLLLVSLYWSRVLRPSQSRHRGGVGFLKFDGKTIAVLSRTSPFAAFVVTLSVSALAIVCVTSLWYGVHPPMGVAILYWAAAIVLAVVATVLAKVRAASHPRNLLIDYESGKIFLPSRAKRKSVHKDRITLEFDRLIGVKVRRSDEELEGNPIYEALLLWLSHRQHEQETTLARFDREEHAESFVRSLESALLAAG